MPSTMTDSFVSNLTSLISGSPFRNTSHTPSLDQAPIHSEDYDTFKPCREIDLIIDGQLYLGDLPGAMSIEQRASLGITHILTVCPNYPSTGPNHLQLPVHDTEQENLLIHLPKACQFIQDALKTGGKVLVHCVMGVSRSATVVSAYLMWTRHWTAEEAISFVQKRRPIIHPNYGFIRQLQAFAQCDYKPSPENEAYLAWKRRSKRDVSNFINSLNDTIPISPYKISLNCDFPKDPEQGDMFLADIEVTYFITISPSQTTTTGLSSVKHHHITASATVQESLLLALPGACNFLRTAINNKEQVLVHCRTEMRACIVIAAYIMLSQNISLAKASSVLEDALPLFQPTQNFIQHLELFEACNYVPTADHPIVKKWLSSSDAGVCKTSAQATALSTAATRILTRSESSSSSGRDSPNPIGRSFDMNAFTETLVQIHKSSLVENTGNT